MSAELVMMLAAKLGVACDDDVTWGEDSILALLRWYFDAHDGGVSKNVGMEVSDARWRQESADWRRLGDIGMALEMCPFKIQVACAPGSLRWVCPAVPAARLAEACSEAARAAEVADSGRATLWAWNGAPMLAHCSAQWREVARLGRMRRSIERTAVHGACVAWLGRRFARAARSDAEFGAVLRFA